MYQRNWAKAPCPMFCSHNGHQLILGSPYVGLKVRGTALQIYVLHCNEISVTINELFILLLPFVIWKVPPCMPLKDQKGLLPCKHYVALKYRNPGGFALKLLRTILANIFLNCQVILYYPQRYVDSADCVTSTSLLCSNMP